MSLRLVYIAPQPDVNTLKKVLKDGDIDVKVGNFAGLGSPDYLTRLGNCLSNQLDYVIYDRDRTLTFISDVELLNALNQYKTNNILGKCLIYVLSRQEIPQEVAKILNKFGVAMVNDIADVSPIFESLRGNAELRFGSDLDFEGASSRIHKSVFNPFNIPEIVEQADVTPAVGNTPLPAVDGVPTPVTAPLPQNTPAKPAYEPDNTFPPSIPNYDDFDLDFAAPTEQPSAPSQTSDPVSGGGDQPYRSKEMMEITGGYSGSFTEEDLRKLLTIKEPKWDYSLVKEDIRRGKKLKKNAISQVPESNLAGSVYIAEQEEINGAYFPAEVCQIINVYANRGGVGKTTVSVMLATQLNWYFNRQVLLGRTQSITSRVLILSLNEFDDLSTHEIGEANSSIEETTGHNILELKNVIEATNGNPQWDDISHCFSVSHRNFIFYLPSMTLKDRYMTGATITAEDYRRIIEVCTKFFSFIVLDSPDMFAEQKGDLMELAFSASDAICIVVEADQRSTMSLFQLLKGLESDSDGTLLDPSKCILVVNKYATGDNPYRGIIPKHDQIPFSNIAKATSKYFAHAVALPLSEYRSYGNVLNGTDPNIKYAAAKLADTVLQVLDENDPDRQ